MEVTKVVNADGETIAANFHAPDGTVLRWKAKKESGLTVQKLSSKCGRCLVTDNEAESAEVERTLTSMLGELGERKVMSFLCDLDEKGTRFIDVLTAMKGPKIRTLEAPRMEWPKAKETRLKDQDKGAVRVLKSPNIVWGKEGKR